MKHCHKKHVAATKSKALGIKIIIQLYKPERLCQCTFISYIINYRNNFKTIGLSNLILFAMHFEGMLYI